jgi:hypothetical protein
MSNPEVSGSSLRCDIEQGIPMYRDVRFGPISNVEVWRTRALKCGAKYFWIRCPCLRRGDDPAQGQA